MAWYFREFRDLTSDHKNFPHKNLVSWWAWLHTGQHSKALVDSEHVYEGHPDGLKASDGRLEF